MIYRYIYIDIETKVTKTSFINPHAFWSHLKGNWWYRGVTGRINYLQGVPQT